MKTLDEGDLIFLIIGCAIIGSVFAAFIYRLVI